ncbi:inner membrane complex protein, putative [Hepatocystis sp. ex Piliocolobus tephrosceles]|nr:inner membrane complex protein, putative [Hepatocystis sp. ex Piliocolobus tephrosceles]
MTCINKISCQNCKCCDKKQEHIIGRTYTYEDFCTFENETNHFDDPSLPFERVIINGSDNNQACYHQIDNEFYTRDILDDVPLISYAQGPYYEKMSTVNKKIDRLPTITYVADPVYIRNKKKCSVRTLAKSLCCDS